MFRRCPFRRALQGRLVPSRRAPQELIFANQLLESGDYQGAADHFETLAHAAESRSGPRAPHFYLQAGRAHILAGQNEAGLAHLKHGLSLFAKRGEWLHLRRAGRRVVAELNERRLPDAAKEITTWLNGTMPAEPHNIRELTPTKKPILPAHCPSCGAALRPDEVDWLDDITAECAYCGSPVREEE